MFKLEDIRNTRVWQEANEEGRQQGRQEGRQQGREEGRQEGREEGKKLATREVIQKLLAKGLSTKEVAELMEISAEEVRRLSKKRAGA